MSSNIPLLSPFQVTQVAPAVVSSRWWLCSGVFLLCQVSRSCSCILCHHHNRFPTLLITPCPNKSSSSSTHRSLSDLWGGPSKSPRFRGGMWAAKSIQKAPKCFSTQILLPACKNVSLAILKPSLLLRVQEPPRRAQSLHEAPQPHVHLSCFACLFLAPITSPQAPGTSLILFLPRHQQRWGWPAPAKRNRCRRSSTEHGA